MPNHCTFAAGFWYSSSIRSRLIVQWSEMSDASDLCHFVILTVLYYVIRVRSSSSVSISLYWSVVCCHNITRSGGFQAAYLPNHVLSVHVADNRPWTIIVNRIWTQFAKTPWNRIQHALATALVQWSESYLLTCSRFCFILSSLLPLMVTFPAFGHYQVMLLGNRLRSMCVSATCPESITWKWNSLESNPQLISFQSNAITITPPRYNVDVMRLRSHCAIGIDTDRQVQCFPYDYHYCSNFCNGHSYLVHIGVQLNWVLYNMSKLHIQGEPKMVGFWPALYNLSMSVGLLWAVYQRLLASVPYVYWYALF